MSVPKSPQKALLFVGTLATDDDAYFDARCALVRSFGDVIMESPPVLWDFTDYYRQEMGEPLFRRFTFFRHFIGQETIGRIKLMTNQIERGLSVQGRRRVNIDPGYLTPAKIVLASTKDYAHRVYLGDGIYAEVTLLFREGQYVPHINTYRDYMDARFLRALMVARTLLQMLSHDQELQ